MAQTVIELGKKVKQKYPGVYDNMSDAEVGTKTKAKYPDAYGDFAFRYDVPTPVAPKEDQKVKIARLQAEADEAQKKAKKTGSFMGILGNTLKGTGETLASSEIGLGKTIAKILPDSVTKQNVYGENIQKLSNDQVILLKQIREREAKGLDATNLKRAYNSNQDLIDENKSTIDTNAKELPTTGQVAGQIGGTALDILTAGTYGKAAQGMKSGKLAVQGPVSAFVAGKTGIPSAKVATKAPLVKSAATATGLPELGTIANQKATGMFTKKGATNILKGAGIGYANDVTLGLQGVRGEDRDGADAFIPGLGTAIGAAIPAVTEGTQSVKNRLDPDYKINKLEGKRYQELEKLERIQNIKKTIEKGRQRGIDIKKVLSETDVLHGAVDKTGKITTKGVGEAADQYRKLYVDDIENIVGESLKKEGKAISPETVYLKLKRAIMNSGLEGAELDSALNKFPKEMKGYALRASDGGAIPLDTLHKAKVDKYSNINFFSDPSTAKYEKTIARALKELVEDHSNAIDVAQANKELSKHFAVLDYLEKLDGRVVEGGKLGKYFASTIGSIVGSHYGPLGSIVGAEAGARIKGNQMSKAFNGKTGKIAPQADAIIDAQKYLKKEPLRLPGRVQDTSSSLNNLGNRQINQATTKAPSIKGISTSITNIPKSANTTIANHLASSRQILENLPLKKIEANGGLKNLLERTKINIVDQLKSQGINDLAEEINKLKAGSYKSLDELEKAITSFLSDGAVRKTAGKAQIGTLLAAAGLGTAAAIAAHPSRQHYQAKKEPEEIKISDEKLSNALKGLESSGGKDKRNANEGEKKWLTGLTTLAIKELKRTGVKNSVKINDEKDVMDASVKYFRLLQKRHPELSPEEVYVKYYWTQGKNEEQKKRVALKFKNLVK